MKKRKDNDTKILVILVPVIFVIMIVSYLVLDKWAVRNEKICKFLGRLWIQESASIMDEFPRNGCFTYEEFYK